MPIVHCPVPEPPAGSRQPVSFATEPWFTAAQEVCLVDADALLAGSATWFSHEVHEIGSPPDWFLDPNSGNRFPDGSQHWSLCKPFSSSDIKRCWELSRFGWAPLLARAWRFTGDSLPRWPPQVEPELVPIDPVNGGGNWLRTGSVDEAAPRSAGLAAQRCSGFSTQCQA